MTKQEIQFKEMELRDLEDKRDILDKKIIDLKMEIILGKAEIEYEEDCL